MAVDVTMPQMGESVVEGTVAKWLVHEGDQVREDQPLCEISTDKVDTEIPSPAAGTIVKLVAQEGETVPVGAQLAVIEPVGKAQAATAPKPSPPPRAEAPVAKPAASATAAQQETNAAAVRKPQPPLRPPAPPAPSADGGRQAEAAQPGRYSPLVMKIAAEHSVDLSRIRGTGLGGRVTKRDVLSYIEKGEGTPSAGAEPAARAAPARAPAAPAAPAVEGGVFRPLIYQPREGDRTEPFSRRRQMIAEHMVYSKTHAPHVGTVSEVDMTRVARFREQHKEPFKLREGFGLTFLPMVVAATARALREFPQMNASVAGNSLVIRKEINIGVAVDTEEGLLVPVVRQADQKSLLGIGREIEELHRKALEKRITADELTGGSFTVTNPGREGNLFGLAIINQPQVGILRMGEVKKRPVVIELDGADTISIRPIMYLALSYDHRVIDGVLGNRFLYRVARILEEGNFEL